MPAGSYFLELSSSSDGSFLAERDNVTQIYRLNLTDSLTIYLPQGHAFAQLNARLHVTKGDGSVVVIPFERNHLGGGSAVYKATCSGPSRFRVECESLEDNSLVQGVEEVVVVSSSTPETPTSSVCLMTAISQRLGASSKWTDLLRVASRQKFNYVHLTPIQVGPEPSARTDRVCVCVACVYVWCHVVVGRV